MPVYVTRREFVRLVAAGSGTLLVPLGCGNGGPTTNATPGFFTAEEQAVLVRFGDFVMPPDQDSSGAASPGGSALGVVPYLELLLTAFDGPGVPTIFAGGPFSGRTPFAASDGTMGTNFPPDSFSNFVPLDRTRVAAWKLRLYGSDGVTGGGPNDAVLGPTVGLRTLFKTGVAAALAAAQGASFASMTDAQVAPIWASLSDDFTEAFTDAVVEAMLSAPEYGGNAGLAGWAIANFEGDNLPFGYAQFDSQTNALVELSSHPISTPNPGTDPAPMDAETESLLQSIANSLPGGRQFFS